MPYHAVTAAASTPALRRVGLLAVCALLLALRATPAAAATTWVVAAGAASTANRRGRHPPEHDVQLREAERERVALIDERDLEPVAELRGEARRQLKAPEPRPRGKNAHARTVLVGTLRDATAPNS